MSKLTFKKWMLKKYEKNELNDIVDHGVGSGFHGLIYYHETVKLYKRYKEEIWDMLYEDAEDQGVSILELIGSFKTAKAVGSHHQFENLLVLYAAEKIASEIVHHEE